MIQIKTVIIHGEKRVMNGRSFSTLQSEVEKVVNGELAKFGDSVIDVKYEFQNETKSTAGSAFVMIEYDPDKLGKKGGK